MIDPLLADAVAWKWPGVEFSERDGALTFTGQAPSEADLQAALDEWKSMQASTEYQRLRKAEYPPIDELIVALWEFVIEDRPEAANQLQLIREQIKSKYPKG